MPLLVVEDNEVLATSLAKGLREDGFEVLAMATGREALQHLSRRDITGMILDLGLPDIDGLEVLRAWREADVASPILVLTARSDVRSRVAALEVGADDYVIKPFEYAEVAARIRALIRRAAAPRWSPQSCAGLVYRDEELAVTVLGKRVRLSPSQHSLLGFLLRRRGETLSRGEILEHVFGYPRDTVTNLVTVHMWNLRRKLGTRVVRVETVRGVGYRLIAGEDPDA